MKYETFFCDVITALCKNTAYSVFPASRVPHSEIGPWTPSQKAIYVGNENGASAWIEPITDVHDNIASAVVIFVDSDHKTSHAEPVEFEKRMGPEGTINSFVSRISAGFRKIN